MTVGSTDTIAEAFDAVIDCIRKDQRYFDDTSVLYYFRGENKNHHPVNSPFPPQDPAMPNLLRDNQFRMREGLTAQTPPRRL